MIFQIYAKLKNAADVATVFGEVHGLVVTGGYVAGGVEELSESELEDMISRNFKAHIHAVRAFLNFSCREELP